VRFVLLLILPPIALLVGFVGLIVSNANSSSSQFLFDLSSAGWSEVIWSAITTAIAICVWKFPGVLTRTAATISGMAGYGLWLTIQVVSLLVAASSVSDRALGVHYFVGASLLTISWIFGFYWSIVALFWSARAGDIRRKQPKVNVTNGNI
jgi:hypothetical protein